MKNEKRLSNKMKNGIKKRIVQPQVKLQQSNLVFIISL